MVMFNGNFNYSQQQQRNSVPSFLTELNCEPCNGAVETEEDHDLLDLLVEELHDKMEDVDDVSLIRMDGEFGKEINSTVLGQQENITTNSIGTEETTSNRMGNDINVAFRYGIPEDDFHIVSTKNYDIDHINLNLSPIPYLYSNANINQSSTYLYSNSARSQFSGNFKTQFEHDGASGYDDVKERKTSPDSLKVEFNSDSDTANANNRGGPVISKEYFEINFNKPSSTSASDMLCTNSPLHPDCDAFLVNQESHNSQKTIKQTRQKIKTFEKSRQQISYHPSMTASKNMNVGRQQQKRQIQTSNIRFDSPAEIMDPDNMKNFSSGLMLPSQRHLLQYCWERHDDKLHAIVGSSRKIQSLTTLSMPQQSQRPILWQPEEENKNNPKGMSPQVDDTDVLRSNQPLPDVDASTIRIQTVEQTQNKIEQLYHYRKLKSFPTNLMNDIHSLNDENVVAWLPDGKSFVVVDCEKFTSQLVRLTFPKDCKYDSFVRKLNRWGFSRLAKGTGIDVFHHRYFHRDYPEWTSKMKGPATISSTMMTDDNDSVNTEPSLVGIEKFLQYLP